MHKNQAIELTCQHEFQSLNDENDKAIFSEDGHLVMETELFI